MSGQDPAVELNTLLTSLEYLLEVRQLQLADDLSTAAQRGDREWTNRLRAEVDKTSRMLQAIRSQSEKHIRVYPQ